MRKNGYRLISIKQYRVSDLFLFALILIVGEALSTFAFSRFGATTLAYRVTFGLLITLIVMVRWGWPSVFYAAGDGLLLCVMARAGWQSYLVYILGNAFVMLLLLALRFIGKNRITGKWYLSTAFVTVGWLLTVFGRTLAALCVGESFASSFLGFCSIGADSGIMTLAMSVIVVLVLRRFDGMWEDQKSYLIRMDKLKKEAQRRDEFGDEPIEIEEETISILKKWDDGLDK